MRLTPSSPAAGNLWWDTSGNPDAGIKIRLGSSWVLVVDGARVVSLLEALTGASQLSGQYVRIAASGFNGNLSTTANTVQKIAQAIDDLTIPTLPGLVSQAHAEAGTVTGTRLWSPLRVAQAIAALASNYGDHRRATRTSISALSRGRSGTARAGHAPIVRGGTGATDAAGARSNSRSRHRGNSATSGTSAQGDVIVLGINSNLIATGRPCRTGTKTDNNDMPARRSDRTVTYQLPVTVSAGRR